MKKFVLILSLITLVLLSFSPAAQATEGISVYVEGQILELDNPPIVQEGCTLAPMRTFFIALGAQVDWDEETRTALAIRGDNEVRISIGSKQPTINGRVASIEVPAQIINGRTYIPLRFAAESLGDKVNWDGDTSTITITLISGPLGLDELHTETEIVRENILETALAQLGTPYLYGGSTPSGFDCSGFVSYVLNQHGISVPQSSEAIYREAEKISLNEMKHGDLVFFQGYQEGPSHVGIYTGDGEFIHAPSPGRTVSFDRVDDPYYWGPRLVGAARVL